MRTAHAPALTPEPRIRTPAAELEGVTAQMSTAGDEGLRVPVEGPPGCAGSGRACDQERGRWPIGRGVGARGCPGLVGTSRGDAVRAPQSGPVPVA